MKLQVFSYYPPHFEKMTHISYKLLRRRNHNWIVPTVLKEKFYEYIEHGFTEPCSMYKAVKYTYFKHNINVSLYIKYLIPFLQETFEGYVELKRLANRDPAYNEEIQWDDDTFPPVVSREWVYENNDWVKIDSPDVGRDPPA